MISTIEQGEIATNLDILYTSNQSYEVAIIEDNKLFNMVLSSELKSTIKKIEYLKKYPIKFSSFHFGIDFLTYLENREFVNSKLIVFSDYHLEKEMNGAQILKQVLQKDIDATVVIMSDTRNKQTSIDTVKMGAHCFLSKEYGIPNNCSQILFRILDIAS